MTKEQAIELAEEYFNFDYLGDVMLDLRKDLDNADLQTALVEELVRVMTEESGESASDVIEEAAKERVAQFVQSAKSAAGKGCGK